MDPEGRFHPQVNTHRVGERYVQPASVLYVCGASAAASLFGHPFALSVSVLGVLFAAIGAWMLERSAGGDGWLSLVLVGVVGPVGFYGGDTWEHAPAVGCALLGTALLVARPSLGSGVLGGVLWALAVALRLETGIVALALGGALLVTASTRKKLSQQPARLGLFVVTALSVLIADRLLERLVLSDDVRASRAVGSSGQLGQAGSDLAQRAVDAMVTTFGVFGSEQMEAIVLGAGFVLALVVLGLSLLGAVQSDILRTAASLVVVAVLILRVLSFGFVPGMFAAAPVAALGAVVAFRRDEPAVARVLSTGGLVALPIVWATQWTGTLVAQWGGRYLLTSGAFMTVAGAVVVRRHLHGSAAKVLVAVSIVIGLVGMGWHIERTTDYRRIWADLAATDCEGALISTSVYLLREGGGTEEMSEQRIGSCSLLTASPAAVPAALDAAEHLGIDRALVLYAGELPRDLEFDGWLIESTEASPVGRIDLTAVAVRRT